MLDFGDGGFIAFLMLYMIMACAGDVFDRDLAPVGIMEAHSKTLLCLKHPRNISVTWYREVQRGLPNWSPITLTTTRLGNFRKSRKFSIRKFADWQESSPPTVYS